MQVICQVRNHEVLCIIIGIDSASKVSVPAKISTSDQRCLNVVDQRLNNVDPTLAI